MSLSPGPLSAGLVLRCEKADAPGEGRTELCTIQTARERGGRAESNLPWWWFKLHVMHESHNQANPISGPTSSVTMPSGLVQAQAVHVLTPGEERRRETSASSAILPRLMVAENSPRRSETRNRRTSQCAPAPFMHAKLRNDGPPTTDTKSTARSGHISLRNQGKSKGKAALLPRTVVAQDFPIAKTRQRIKCRKVRGHLHGKYGVASSPYESQGSFVSVGRLLQGLGLFFRCGGLNGQRLVAPNSAGHDERSLRGPIACESLHPRGRRVWKLVMRCGTMTTSICMHANVPPSFSGKAGNAELA